LRPDDCSGRAKFPSTYGGSCRRSSRTVEIQTLEAVRLYDRDALWKDFGHRLFDDTCTRGTGRHDEDGC